MNTAQNDLTPKIFWIVAALCLLPWFAVHLQLSLNGDTTWLVTATRRLLAGGTMADSYYEVNPPLSILYHIPPVLLEKILPIPAYHIIFLYFTGLIALSTSAVNAVLKRWSFLGTEQRYALLAAYLAGNTIFSSIALGEREQIVLLGLMPFVLAQLSLTWGDKLPKRLLWPIIIGGTLAVLIKPHFGIVPTFLLVYRMVAQKRFWIIRDLDFMALAVGTVSYIAFVWFFFHDYVTVILPDALALYITNKDYASALPELFLYTYLFLAFILIEAFLTPLGGRQKRLLILLYAGALLCLVPYAVQMKGFYYQLIPALIFFFCAFALSLHSYVRFYLKNAKNLTLILTAVIFILAYVDRPLLLAYPKHGDYKNMPLSQEIAKCPKPCPYFIFNNSIEILHPTAFYDGQENASRFPTYWFLPYLVQEQYKLDRGIPSSLSPEDIEHYRKKYGAMTAEDWRRFKPRMLIIGQYRLTPDEKNFDFPAFLSASPTFKEQWAKYRKDRTVTINRRPYFAGTALDRDFPLTYDIYLRQ